MAGPIVENPPDRRVKIAHYDTAELVPVELQDGQVRYLMASGLKAAEIEGLVGGRKTFNQPTSIQWIGVSLPTEAEPEPFEVRLDVTELTPTLSATPPFLYDENTGLPYTYTTGEELAQFHTVVVDGERFPVDPRNPHALKMKVSLEF